MALADRDIIITPNRGASNEPIIQFRGADASSSATVALRVINSGTVGTLSFEGGSGQLLSITDSFAGTIFSANDISGIPSIEVLDSGLVKIAEYNGYLRVGGNANNTNATSTNTGVLQVAGGAGIWKDIYIGGSGNIVGNLTVTGTLTAGALAGAPATQVTITDDPSAGAVHYPTFVAATSGNNNIKVDSSGLMWQPVTNRLGIGTTPSTNLHVYAASDPVITLQAGGGSYPYIQLTTPSSGTGYLIKNIGTGNSVLNTSLYMYNGAGPIQFVPNATIGNSVTIDVNGRLGVGTGAQPTLYTPVSVANANHYSPSDTNRILNWWSGTGGTELYNSVHGVTVGYNSAATDQPQYVGLHLFNPNATNNNWSPMLGFGGLSTSGGYMNEAVGMAAQLIGNSTDSNFRGGDLHFWIQNATDSNGRGFAGSAVSRIVFKGNGNNGFGVTNPQAKLHLQTGGTTLLRLDSTSSTGDSQILLTDNNNPTGEGLRITYRSAVGDTFFNNIYTVATDAFHWQKGDYGAGTSLMRITMAGNIIKSINGATIPGNTISDTAPSSVFNGDLWWESDTGRLRVYYTDANTSQWVDATPQWDSSTFFSRGGGGIYGPVSITGTLDVKGNVSLDNGLYVSGVINAAGGIVGTISASTIAVTNDTATGSFFYPTFVSAAGTPSLKIDNSGFSYRPSDGQTVIKGGLVSPLGIYGATTGAPDVRIWSISRDQYPDWGIFYNEGSPDYIEFKTGGTVTSQISLDNGDGFFGVTGNGRLAIGTASPGASRFQVNGNFTNLGSRLLTSNGSGWAADGTTPISVISGSTTDTRKGVLIGLALHNDSPTNSTYSPMIAFSRRSNSTSYNHAYAAILGQVTGQGSDSNWCAGDIVFQMTPSGGYYSDSNEIRFLSTGHITKYGGIGVPGVTFSDTAPSGRYPGDLWYETDTGRMKVYYYDGSSYQWVDTQPIFEPSQWYPRGGGTIQGAVGIQSTLSVAGWIQAGGSITANYSDRRLKTNVRPIYDALNKVLRLNGVHYNPNELAGSFGYDVAEEVVGLFADEVNEVLPEAVKPAPFDTDEQGNSKSGENYKTIQYEKLVPLLVEAIKEQQKIINQIQSELARLANK